VADGGPDLRIRSSGDESLVPCESWRLENVDGKRSAGCLGIARATHITLIDACIGYIELSTMRKADDGEARSV